jgi:hypothetical protein
MVPVNATTTVAASSYIKEQVVPAAGGCQARFPGRGRRIVPLEPGRRAGVVAQTANIEVSAPSAGGGNGPRGERVGHIGGTVGADALGEQGRCGGGRSLGGRGSEVEGRRGADGGGHPGRRRVRLPVCLLSGKGGTEGRRVVGNVA